MPPPQVPGPMASAGPGRAVDILAPIRLTAIAAREPAVDPTPPDGVARPADFFADLDPTAAVITVKDGRDRDARAVSGQLRAPASPFARPDGVRILARPDLFSARMPMAG